MKHDNEETIGELKEARLPKHVNRDALIGMVTTWNAHFDEGKPPQHPIEILDLITNPHPDFFHKLGADTALVDLSTFAGGPLGVLLRDANMTEGFAIQREARAIPADAPPLTPMLCAAYLAGHFDGFCIPTIEGDRVTGSRGLESASEKERALKIIGADAPKRGAPIDEWAGWLQKGREKPMTRIIRGTITFRTMSAEAGN